MINLIKMNIYRFVKARSTWILLSFIIIIAIGLEFPFDGVKETNSVFNNFVISIQNGNIVQIGILYIVLFTNIYMKSGYIKNLTGVLSKRNKIYLAHMTIALMFYIVAFVISIIAASMADLIFYGKVVFGFNASSVLYILCQAFIMSVFCMGVSCVVMVSNSVIVGLLYGFVSYMFLDSFIVGILNQIIKAPFNINQLGIVNCIENLPINFDSNKYIITIISGLVYFVLINLFARVFIYKREIIF